MSQETRKSQLRPVAAPPRPHADDVTEDVTEEALEAEETTLGELAAEVRVMAGFVNVLGRNVAGLTGQQELLRREVAQLSGLVTGDHAPRLTKVETATVAHEPRLKAVEQRTGVQKAAGMAGKGTKWLTLAAGAITLATQFAAQLKPGAVGPLQAIGELLAKFASFQ